MKSLSLVVAIMILYGKINLRVPHPPPHFRNVWDYKNADAVSIQRAIENFNCQYAFERKTINEKVQVFSEVLTNILSNFVPHKLLKFNYKQHPWMNLQISSFLRKRAKLTKLFYKYLSVSLKELLMIKSTECSNLMLTVKENYQKKMAEKLDNPFTDPKAYWSILNNFLGKKKTPNIPPLILNDFLFSDFTTKANLFNNFFASQCSPVANFPEDWKKANIILFTKKESKNCLKNYRPISLLPIFSKIFEKLIFNALFHFFVQNQLFTDCQSGFIPGVSCISQLLSITQEIHKSFDCNPPEYIRGVFLDISKAFYKVWHEGLIFKLKIYVVEGKLIIL